MDTMEAPGMEAFVAKRVKFLKPIASILMYIEAEYGVKVR
jgi:hypothetical protein